MKTAIVCIGQFNGGKSLDKNGKPAVYLTSIRGTELPAKARVISGTVAERLGLKAGQSAAIGFTRQPDQIVGKKTYERYSYVLIDGNVGAAIAAQMLTEALVPSKVAEVATSKAEA